MIGNSAPEYICIRFLISAFRLVAPTSILYVTTAAYTFTLPISPWVAALAGAEALFYLLVCLPRKARLQAPPTYKPPPLTKSERGKLFAKCCIHLDAVLDTESCASYLRGWFLPAGKRLHRRDAVDWLLWAIFSVDRKDAHMEEWKEEIDEYISVIERILGEELEDGDGEGAKGMRLTLDPVMVVHRPLVWYSIVGFVDAYATLNLSYMGFKHYSSPKRFQAFPPRPFLSLLSHTSCLPRDTPLSYWYRPHKSPNKLPILFMHGVGIGLYFYIPFIRSLIAQDPDVGILLIELLPISMHMTPTLIPPRPLLIASINTILESLNIFRVVLASHSYGTVLTASIIRPPPPPTRSLHEDEGLEVDGRNVHLSLQRKLAHVLLIDPIPILLHLPAVAHNFLYRRPRKASEWMMWYFACTDADVARTLGRGFFWEEVALWKDDLKEFMKAHDGEGNCNGDGDADRACYSDGEPDGPLSGGVDGARRPSVGTNASRRPRNLAILLAGKDQIVPAETIRRYLTDDSPPIAYWRKRGWGLGDLELGVPTSKALLDGEARGDGVEGERVEGDLEVLFYPELDHSTVFDTQERRQGMLDVLHRFVRDP